MRTASTMSATTLPVFQLVRRSRSACLAAGGTPRSSRYRSAQAIRTASCGSSQEAANDSNVSSFLRSRPALRRSHKSTADGRCDSVRMGQYCQHCTRLAIKISIAKTLDLRRGIATNELSDLQKVCLWRRFFGHSFVPCRRFARLYRLLPKQDILISRVLHPFGDPRLAFFNRGKTSCGFLPTDPIFPSAGALKRREPARPVVSRNRSRERCERKTRYRWHKVSNESNRA